MRGRSRLKYKFCPNTLRQKNQANKADKVWAKSNPKKTKNRLQTMFTEQGSGEGLNTQVRNSGESKNFQCVKAQAAKLTPIRA